MTSFLLFRLHGPLSAWGDIAVGEFRPSVDHPSRSAVMGLVAAALGYDRTAQSQHDQLNGQFCLGICVQRAGCYVRDFHTIQSPKGKSGRDAHTRKEELSSSLITVLTQREYISDAVYTIGFWSRASDDTSSPSLPTLQQALKTPVWQLCLGRKSCPLGEHMEPQIIDAPTFRAALEQSHFESDAWLDITTDKHAVYWDGMPNDPRVGFDPMLSHTRHDSPGQRSDARSFAPRQEYQSVWQPSTQGVQ